MRISELIAIGVTGLAFSGCSQISSAFKKKAHYHDATQQAVYVGDDASLRSSPGQDYQFSDQSYDGTVYDTASLDNSDFQFVGGTEYVYAYENSDVSQYVDYDVEIYASSTLEARPAYLDPRDTEFVKLNGDSDAVDWQNCETLNRGYLLASEYDFSLNPDFEVCMRNKGYVFGTEYGQTSKPTLKATSAGLRGIYPQTSYQYPSSSF